MNRNRQQTINPIQQRRLQLDITQEYLAAVAGVSKPLVMRIEQGIIGQVNPSVLNYLYGSDPINQARALDTYETWRVDTRVKNIEYFNYCVDHPETYDGSWLSFRTFIHHTQVGFCKLYCIHPQVLSNFEKKNDRRELSKYLKEAFISAGNERINKLEERMRYWVDSRGL